MSHAGGRVDAGDRARLGRSPSTISRELRRNGEPRGGYRARSAHAMAYERAARPKPAKLAVNLALREKVEQDLRRELLTGADRRPAARGVPRRPGDVGVARDDLPVALRAVARRAAP